MNGVRRLPGGGLHARRVQLVERSEGGPVPAPGARDELRPGVGLGLQRGLPRGAEGVGEDESHLDT